MLGVKRNLTDHLSTTLILQKKQSEAQEEMTTYGL